MTTSFASKTSKPYKNSPLISEDWKWGYPKEKDMTWEIVAGIVTLLGMVGIIIGWTSKIAGTLAKLSTSVDNLNDTVKEFKGDQNILIEQVGHQDVVLARHEEQIKNLQTIVQTKINSDK